MVMNKKLFLSILLLAVCFAGQAQRNFYHRLDVGSSNIYSFVVSNLGTALLNYATHDMLFDNSFTYSFFSGEGYVNEVSTKRYDPMGITMRDLFNDAYFGTKLGYQSDNMGFVNWGIYGSAHYKINQFKAKFMPEMDYERERLHYMKTGVGLMLTLGSIEHKTRVQIEAALRYDFPLGYAGVYGASKDMLESGLSSHYAIKVAGFTWLSVGVYADINHYNLYNVTVDKANLKMYNIGITFTITPKRGEDWL